MKPADDAKGPTATRGGSQRRATDERASEVLENASDAFVALDREWRYTYVNGAAERLTGLGRAEMLGRTRWEVLPDLIGAPFEGACRRAMDEGVTGYVEAYSPPFDRWFGETAYPSANGIAVQAHDITNRKRAVERLRASEARFRSYFELGLIGMAITSPTRGIVEVNDCICEVLGYERDELLRLTWAELTHPDDLAADEANFNGVLAGEIDGYSMDKRWIRKDGKIVDATISVKCLRRADGTVDEFVALLQDVTARKRAEEASRRGNEELEQRVVERTNELTAVDHALRSAIREREQAERLLREAHQKIETILDSITDNVYGLSSDWRFTYLNTHAREAMKRLAKDPTQLIGQVVWDEFPDVPDEADLRRAMSERVSIVNEVHYPPSGQWFENHIHPSTDGGLLTFQRYITERKRAEEKLVESERRCRRLLESIPHHVWSFRPDGSVGYVNQRLIAYTGLSVEELQGGWAAVHPDDVARAKAAWEEAWAHGTAYEIEQRMRGRDGRYRRFVCRGVPIKDEQGRLVEWFGTDTDVEDRRQAEEERTRLLRRLMTAQEEERRRLSREMHDQCGQQLSALILKLATLRNDCRTYPELCDQIESLEAIARQLDSDISSVVRSLRPTALDDFGLAIALANFVSDWSKRFGIHAALHSSGVDEERLAEEVETVLYRVVQEALTNVAKHAGASNVAILLERRADHVSLIVEDDGDGFDADRAFDASEKGLGLEGMRERAMLVGGTLGIESRPGDGTTVVVRIPVSDGLNRGDRG
jgi:PAS domain S-box-containing protein